MLGLYDGKIINFEEQIPLKLRMDQLIFKLTVLRFDSIKPSSLRYGSMIEDTIYKCVVADKDKSKIKVIGSEMQKKQLFKTDFNF